MFGHAGGLVGDSMIVCDGVTATKGADGRHRFAISNACWRGELGPEAIGRIRWSALPAHPGPPLYRAGAIGTGQGKAAARIVFAGGSARPYNYDGIGYDRMPAAPSSHVVSFDLRCNAWTKHRPLPQAGMDFRGMIAAHGRFLLFGGMRAAQTVSDGVIRFDLPAVGCRRAPS